MNKTVQMSYNQMVQLDHVYFNFSENVISFGSRAGRKFSKPSEMWEYNCKEQVSYFIFK